MCILNVVFNIYVPLNYIRLFKGNLAPTLRSKSDINIDTRHLRESNRCWTNGAKHSTLGSVEGVPVGGNPVVDRHVYFQGCFEYLCSPKFNPIVEGEVVTDISDHARYKYRHHKFPWLQYLLAKSIWSLHFWSKIRKSRACQGTGYINKKKEKINK